jgi:hypothetical protein
MRLLRSILLVSSLVLFPHFLALAFDASSTNFGVRWDTFSSAGFSTSTSFNLINGLSESVSGFTTSTSFNLQSGKLSGFGYIAGPRYYQTHFHWRNDDGTESTATSATGGSEDTTLSGLAKSTVKRLRFEISNEGGTFAGFSSQQFMVEYAALTGSCAGSTYTDVGAGGGDWDMDASQLTEAGDTTNIAVSSGGVTDENLLFLSPNGGQRETTSQTSALYLGGDSFVELEYAVSARPSATDGETYCFRLTNAGATTNFVYSNYATVTLAGGANSAPTVSALILNGGSAITLTENTTTSISVVGTITDTDTFSDISYATGTIYRSGVTSTSSCVEDDNNCYRIASTSCILSSCSGNSCTVTCTMPNVRFFAEPTDSGTYSGENWVAGVSAYDLSSATGFASTSSGVELNTLYALNVTGAIAYGTVGSGSDTAGANQTAEVTNTGNALIDNQLSGTDMTFDVNTILVSNQKYSTSTFTFSSCTTCTNLSTTPTAYDINLAKPTSITPVTANIYWGLSIPGGRPPGSYTGTNTFTAITGI